MTDLATSVGLMGFASLAFGHLRFLLDVPIWKWQFQHDAASISSHSNNSNSRFDHGEQHHHCRSQFGNNSQHHQSRHFAKFPTLQINTLGPTPHQYFYSLNDSQALPRPAHHKILLLLLVPTTASCSWVELRSQSHWFQVSTPASSFALSARSGGSLLFSLKGITAVPKVATILLIHSVQLPTVQMLPTSPSTAISCANKAAVA